MRTPDDDEPTATSSEQSSRSLGDGMAADGSSAADWTDGYGSPDDEFYEDEVGSYDDSTDSTDSSYDDPDDPDVVEIEPGIVVEPGLSEEEAEDILEDILDDTFGPQADQIVDDLQETSGLEAVEILEVLTDTDLSDPSGSEATESSAAEMFEPDVTEASSPFDNPFDRDYSTSPSQPDGDDGSPDLDLPG
jgi:hypothetical protein